MNESTVRTIRLVAALIFGLVSTGAVVMFYDAGHPDSAKLTLILIGCACLPICVAICYLFMWHCSWGTGDDHYMIPPNHDHHADSSND
jgi:hypothetical protein